MSDKALGPTAGAVQEALLRAEASLRFCANSLADVVNGAADLDDVGSALGVLETVRTLNRQVQDLQAACIEWLSEAGVRPAALDYDV